MIPSLSEDFAMNATINTTEDCNLRCKYCYETKKTKGNIKLEYCKKFIDMLLEDTNYLDIREDEADYVKNIQSSGLLLDFIGGDSLVDPQLLDDISTYAIKKIFTTNATNAKNWRNHFKITISTNGTLFSRPDVREFCEKWKDILHVGVSIDGCPEIHDANRIFPNGEGSMKAILKNWDWFKSTFPLFATTTKSTLAKNSIPYLYDSLKWMHEELGLNYINQNFIMEENYCTKEDYDLYDKQLEKCVQYVLDHRHDLYWSMLHKEQFAYPMRSQGDDWERSFCGSGLMPALSIDGKIYPCFRWLPHTNESHTSKFVCGDVFNGWYAKENFYKVRHLSAKCNITKEEKCLNCNYESACAYCIGGCYAEFGDFIRTTHICEITKLQCKWAKIYWDEYNKLEGIVDDASGIR